MSVIRLLIGSKNHSASLNDFFTMSFLFSQVTAASSFSLTIAISSSVITHCFLVTHQTKSFVALANTAPNTALCDKFLMVSLVPDAMFHLDHIISHHASLSIAVSHITARVGF